MQVNSQGGATAWVGANDTGGGGVCDPSAGTPLAGELQAGAGVALGLLLGAVGDGPPRAPGGSEGREYAPMMNVSVIRRPSPPPPHAKKVINRAVPSNQAVIE